MISIKERLKENNVFLKTLKETVGKGSKQAGYKGVDFRGSIVRETNNRATRAERDFGIPSPRMCRYLTHSSRKHTTDTFSYGMYDSTSPFQFQ